MVANRLTRSVFLVAAVTVSLAAALPVDAQGMRNRIISRMKAKSAGPEIDPATMVAGAALKTVSYGPDAAQAMDIYLPPHPSGAPVIVMVHGGGWRIGDKTSRGVIENKLKHWLPKGFILVSVNYRMLPEARVEAQAEDVARATAHVQAHASEWGGDGGKVVLMGHSAGAHLVALLSADPAWVVRQGGAPWCATVSIDSAGYDIASVMGRKHPKLYDDAFGSDPAYWRKLSPSQNIAAAPVPMLLVCALKRPDDSCGQADAFAARLKASGHGTEVVRQDLNHMEANAELGLPGAYTDAVDAFLTERLH